MSRPRFEQLPTERQQEILRIAAAEFARGGLHGTSYNQLLAQLGLGKGSAYYYFEDKQDLFLTAVRHCYLAFFRTLGNLPLPSSVQGFWDYVDQLTLRGLNFVHDDPTSAALLQAFARERFRIDVLSSPELLKGMGDTYALLIRLGQQLGAVRQDLPFELLLGSVQAVAGAFDQWFVGLGRRPAPEELLAMAKNSTDLIRGMTAPR